MYNELVMCHLNVCPDALQLCSNVFRIHQTYENVSILSHMLS
jgi:glutaredoxin-related protein